MLECPSRRGFLKGAASLGLLACLRPDLVFAQTAAGGPAPAPADIDFQYRTLSVKYLPRLKADFERLDARHQLSHNKVFRSYIGGARFELPKELPGARSLVVVSLPGSLAQIDFWYRGRKHEISVPAGYWDPGLDRDVLRAQVKRRAIGDPDAKLEPARLPLKLLAARSGLSRYGRNNISYVRGYGSLHSLRAYYTEHEFPDNGWRSVGMLRQCKGCDICFTQCPTQAVPEQRFVIDAGRCLPLYNEVPDPFPDWIDPGAHNALVGCLKCQVTCPANREVVGKVTKLAEATEEETTRLLAGDETPAFKQAMEEKFARFDLAGDLKHLARNLRPLLERA